MDALYRKIAMMKYVMQDLCGTLKYVPCSILVGVLFYFLFFFFVQKKKQKKLSVVRLLFFVYVAMLIIITYFSRESGDGGRLDLKIGSGLGINLRNNAYIVENILLFVPFGFLLSLLWKKSNRLWKHFSAGFLTSLLIEALQLVSERGIFQADDIITNTLGALAGYLLYFIFVSWWIRKKDA